MIKVHGLNNWKVGKDVNRAHLWEEDQDFLLDRLDLLSKGKNPNTNQCFMGDNWLLFYWHNEREEKISRHWARRWVGRDTKDMNTFKELLLPVLSLIGVSLMGGVRFYRSQFPHLCEGALHLAPPCKVPKLGNNTQTDRHSHAPTHARVSFVSCITAVILQNRIHGPLFGKH